ncbi:MAG TPA: bifunctional diguanylate cyclase/phosphodiesterase [Xanthobacteraceae bacterium]|nr:bifunctional diguanylate cyclase/phosphodiesterase [Xanthobacteraceae bacterium]
MTESLGTHARRLATPRLITTLGLLALSATFFCALVGYLLLRHADDNREQERRAALVGALTEIRASGTDIAELDSQLLDALARVYGLKDLRFEHELGSSSREAQPALDREGRIVGWFTWERDQATAEIFAKLLPFLVLGAFSLVTFAGITLSQVRQSLRDLAASERRAWQLAHEDPLTGLPNQRRMLRLIDEALLARRPTEVVSLAIADVDRLSDANDAFGRAGGDRLLAALAERLRQAVGETAGRTGDDEFALLLTTASAGEARDRLASVAQALVRPYWLGEQSAQIAVTMGVAHADQEKSGREELLRRASLALRAAKRKNRGGLLEFVPAMEAEFAERRFIERELRKALAEGALDVHYQPIVTADGTAIAGVEALIRWTHPERGAIAPDVFVPVAEQTGQIGALGDFVLRRVLDDARRWPQLFVAINISAVQVRDPTLVTAVAEALSGSDIPPSRVVLEMTESVLIENPDEVKRRLDALRAIGVQLALDDFGAGYSSLTYLQRFKFDRLKIDRGFVRPLGKVRGSEAIVQAIVALGRALELYVMAEGVENEEQRVLLRLAGCEEMQGFLFAKPAPREAVDRLLAAADAAGPRPILRASPIARA